MVAADEVKTRILELIAQVPDFLRLNEHGQVANHHVLASCVGWIAAAFSIVQTACEASPRSAYLQQIAKLQERDRGYMIGEVVLSIVEVLKHLLVDMDRGLLVNMERQISAETFDDLLDHADAYLAEGRKEPAGVIAGVVFEDTVRRLCAVAGIEDANKTVEPLINALKAGGHLSKLEGKEAVAAGDLRAAATHARWDEFNSEQVKSVIAFARRLLRDKLAA